MFAVIKTGGKQYKVAKDDTIVVETVAGAPGSTVELNDVLMIGDAGKEPQVDALDKASVFAEVVDQTKGSKIIVFKKKRRKGYRRKAGHRQNHTLLRITGISASGRKPAKAAAKAKRRPKQPEAEKKAESGPKKQAPKTSAKPAAKAKQGPEKSAAKKAKKAKKPAAKKAEKKSKE